MSTMTITDEENNNRISVDASDVDEQIYPTYKLRVINSILQKQGISTADFLCGTGLEERDITSVTARISRRQVVTAYTNAMTLSPDSAIGLLSGRHIQMTDYGMYGYALISNACLRDALEFSIKYHQLATPTVRMSLYLDNNDTVAVFGMEDRLNVPDLHQFNLDFQFSLVFSLFKDMVGDEFLYKEIYADYPAPTHAARFVDVLGCPIFFDKPRNELRFDPKWLDTPLVRANPITAEMTREACDQILMEMSATAGLAHEVYGILTDNLRLFSDIESVARHLNLTSRTLRRKLAAQGTSFNKILTEIRKQVSTVYLRKTELSVCDVAERLGFSDSANFRHAFKRWTGKTPGAYRKS